MLQSESVPGLWRMSAFARGSTMSRTGFARLAAALGMTATILGAFKDWDCELAESHLCPGDTLVLYTDGITESFNPAGDEFGERRLLEALQRNRHCSCHELCSAIVDEVRRFSPHEQHDDITLIVAKCTSLSDGARSISPEGTRAAHPAGPP